MATVSDAQAPAAPSQGFKFPTAYAILFALIAVVAAATWVVNRGQDDRQKNEQLDKHVPHPGTDKTVDRNPQGLRAALIAPIAGFDNPDSNQAAAIDVARRAGSSAASSVW